MPRKSRAEIETAPLIQPHAPTPVLQPPPGLSDSARAAFVALAADHGPDHFKAGDTTLLAR
jgi:hypothetical protein